MGTGRILEPLGQIVSGLIAWVAGFWREWNCKRNHLERNVHHWRLHFHGLSLVQSCSEQVGESNFPGTLVSICFRGNRCQSAENGVNESLETIIILNHLGFALWQMFLW